MRIGIDVRQMMINDRGIAVYISNFIRNLLDIDNINEYILYYNSANEYAMCIESISKKLNEYTKYNNVSFIDLKSKGSLLWEQIYLPLRVLKDNLDVLHMPSNRAPLICNCKLISTVHDIIELRIIEKTDFYKLNTLKGRFYEWRIKQYIKLIYNWALKKSNYIITISEISKKEIQDTMGTKDRKIGVITHGIDSEFRHLHLDKKYIMTLGGSALQKNPEGPVEAYSYLSEKIKNRYPLLIIGCNDEKKTRSIVRKYGVKNAVIKGFVSKRELVELYNQTKIFLFLSIIEGFGFPPLEAMACGAVPISYNISPMKENIGNARLCVEFKNNREAAKKMEYLINDENEYNDLKEFGFKRVVNFSWQISAKEHLNVYEKVTGVN